MLAEALPKRIRYVRQGDLEGSYRGYIPLERLPRLMDFLEESDDGSEGANAQVDVQLLFRKEGPDRFLVRVRAACRTQLSCQRCLQAVDVGLETDHEIVLSNRAKTIEDLQHDVDGLLTEGDFVETAALIEDQLLLAVPMVPKHEDCAIGYGLSAGGAEREVEETEAEPATAEQSIDRHRPFADLKAMTASKKAE